jgi:hypothetical protein
MNKSQIQILILFKRSQDNLFYFSGRAIRHWDLCYCANENCTNSKGRLQICHIRESTKLQQIADHKCKLIHSNMVQKGIPQQQSLQQQQKPRFPNIGQLRPMSAPFQGPSYNVPPPQIFYGGCGTNFDPNFNAPVSTIQQVAAYGEFVDPQSNLLNMHSKIRRLIKI